MAAITLQRLRQIIEIAYEAGYHGCLDLKNVYSEEIIQKLLEKPDTPLNKNDGWKIYKAKELWGLPAGSMFEHSTRGKGFIEWNGRDRSMHWENGTISGFVDDDVPWTEPMRLLGTMMKVAPKLVRKRLLTGF